MEWEALRAALQQDDPERFTTNLRVQLQQGRLHFKQLQECVQRQCLDQVEAAPAAAFLVACLQLLLHSPDRDGPAVALGHLLLELLPANVHRLPAISPALHRQAAALFVVCCRHSKDARLALKVAQAFGLQQTDVGDAGMLAAHVKLLLQDRTEATPAVGLLMHFQGLADQFDVPQLLHQLVLDSQEALAEKWAAQLPRSCQLALVRACVAEDRLRTASRAVRGFGLRDEFPGVERQYRERSLANLLDKRLWSVASTFVGEDGHFQETLVRTLVQEGELALAEQYRLQYGLPPDATAVSPAQLAADAERRANLFLPLTLAPEAIHFVDTEEDLCSVAEHLYGAEVLGLDCEWKPSHEGGDRNPASILQLATRTQAVVIDLLALQPSPALDAALRPLLQSTAVIKTGCGIAGDMKKLAKSYPQVAAFQTARGLLDLQPLYADHMQRKAGKQKAPAQKADGEAAGRVGGGGLSRMAAALLGKPLDKSMQMSNWEQRPLTERQLAYAFLDAQVSVQILEAICTAAAADDIQWLHPLAFEFSAQPAKRRNIGQPAAQNGTNGIVIHTATPDEPPPATASDTYNSNGSLAARIDDGVQTGTKGAEVLDQEVGVQGELPPRLQLCLEQHHPQHAVLWLPSHAGPTATAAGAAQTLRANPDSIAKSLAFYAAGAQTILVLRGSRRVDYRKVFWMGPMSKAAIELVGGMLLQMQMSQE